MEEIEHRWLTPAGRSIAGPPGVDAVLVAAVPGHRMRDAAGPLGSLRRQFPWAPLVITLPALVLGAAALALPAALEAQEVSVAEIERLHVEAQRFAAQGTEEGRRHAIERWTRMARESERRGDAIRHAVALNNIGLVEHAGGNDERALAALEAAWTVATGSGDANGQFTAAYNRGRILERLGRRGEALGGYEDALRALELLPDRKGTPVHTDLSERIEALRGEPEGP